MLQKIKYSVGSKLKVEGTREENDMEIEILDISKNEYAALIVVVKEKDLCAYYDCWMTQEQLDEQGYKLVSFPPRWIPEIGQNFFYATSAGLNERDIWKNNTFQMYMLKDNNVFKTYEECQNKIDEINAREI